MIQLRFTTLPPRDEPDLERIEAVASLSVPLRSTFRRGVHLYDVPTLVTDQRRLDEAQADTDSGVSIRPEGARWSFGRATEIDLTYGEADGLALGNWLPHVEETEPTWEDMTFAWSDAPAAWNASAKGQRRAVLAGWFVDKVPYLALRDASGALIGYRRCRACRPVRQAFAGPYAFGGQRLAPKIGGEAVYIEAMTAFRGVAGVTAKSVSLCFGGASAGKPGGQWLSPGELAGAVEIASSAVSLPLRATVRERIKFMVRF